MDEALQCSMTCNIGVWKQLQGALLQGAGTHDSATPQGKTMAAGQRPAGQQRSHGTLSATFHVPSLGLCMTE